MPVPEDHDLKARPLTEKEVGEILQIGRSTLEDWLDQFSDFFSVSAAQGEFNEEDLETLTQIKELLQTELYTPAGAHRRLTIDRTLNSALGLEQNFKNTVFFMFSAIMEELRAAREESERLAQQLQALDLEKTLVEARLLAEQNKGLWEFIKGRLGGKEREQSGKAS